MKDKDILRRCIFRPYRKGMGPTFTLVMWDCHRTRNGGPQWQIGYKLTMHDRFTGPGCGTRYQKHDVLFEGEDFGCSPLHSIDGDACVESLMSFLCLRPGDTDAEYFDKHTPEQLAFASEHAEALHGEVDSRFCDENGHVKGGGR